MIVHEPVLLQEVLAHLVPIHRGALMVDATIGEGGHAEAFLVKYPDLVLIGVDADSSILEVARQRLAAYADRVRLVNEWFSRFFAEYDEERNADLILMDLGISRFHYEASGRGFSFDRDESLDMRLGSDLSATAADMVNTLDQRDLAEVFFRYGEERFARPIASRIVREREKEPIESAARLARIVASAVPAQSRRPRIHPATRTFQALRIAVNRELEQLEDGLAEALTVLAPGGRIGVITFHSLEDRIVKRFFRDKSRDCTCPPEWPICQCGGKGELRLVTAKPIAVSPEEITRNPASRSAKLRVAEKRRPAPVEGS
ncbi:MAG TPA: 16S rRNA (cytosine(1402)-N(4))-methyltransferase RsmH [Spirochaetia bacterium]|nr:16S rRNA (cytosine(1402)-N(4))-methyltransferase RsmH [Spirochaetia bacterium]